MIPMFHGQNRGAGTVPFTPTYGRLYNWYAVNTGILAPTGWHIPTYTEMDDLSLFLGGNSSAGAKLKEVGLTHWLTEVATDQYGFSAVGSGIRNTAGDFNDITLLCWIWTNLQQSSTFAYFRRLTHDTSEFLLNSTQKSVGMTVRCIKDDSTNAGTVIDASGNEYPTITIGTQVWMRQNLKTLKYNDGTDIPFEGVNPGYFTSAEWAALTTPGVCAYDNLESNV